MLRSSRSSAVGLTLVSVATLVYELTQVRVFAYSLHPVAAYSAIALAMLGFGLGATWLALRPPKPGRDNAWLAWRSLWLGASMLLANALFARVSHHVIPPSTMQVSVGWTAVALLPCVVPYVAAGLVTTRVLQLGMAQVGRLYAYNLGGSAVGCVLSVLLLRPVGAERLIVAAGALAALGGLAFVVHERGCARQGCALAASALAALVPTARWLTPFQPDPSDLIYVQAARHHSSLVREYSEWDPVGRIDIVRHEAPWVFVSEPVAYRTITNDSGAMSLLLEAPAEPGWGQALFEETLYGVPYRLRTEPNVLVIGIGGGIDVLTALHWHARHVTAVEVSGSTLRALTGPYADFARWPRRTDEVTLVQADGRSFAKSTTQRFDIVQMSGVDTFTMHSASAMVTAEDYLYTVDALADFLGLLRPDGLLAVTRFGDEAMNLSAVAAAALRQVGVAAPERHIVAIRQQFAAGVLLKRSPFSPEEIALLRHVEDRQQPTGLRIAHYDAAGLRGSAPLQLLYPSGRYPDPRYQRFFEALARGREQAAQRELGTPFVAPTDDRPYYMLTTLLTAGPIGHPIVRGLIVSTALIAATSVLLILLPLRALRRGARLGLRPIAGVGAYFFALGAAFMLFEVALIHRSIVFVGSPGAAVGVVIASILLSAGIGAWASGAIRWTAWRRLQVALAALATVGWLHYAWAGPLFEALFAGPMPVRWLTAALALAPGGFFAGWFFPVGLSLAARRSTTLVPWAIAVNGFASVLGSLAALGVSVLLGFRTVFAIAMAGYALGVLGLLVGTAPERRAGGPGRAAG